MNKAAFILCLSVVVISPLLFGSTYPFTYTPVFILVLLAGLLTLKASINKDKAFGIRFRWQENPLLLLFLAYIVFLLITMVPLPGSLLTHLSIVAKIVSEKSIPAAAISGIPVHDYWDTLTPYVYPARMSLIRWIIYGLFLWSLIAALNSRKRIETAVIIILTLGCFESLYGIIQTYSGYEHIWWFKKLAHIGFASGTYPNRNHFAGFMEMGIVLSLAYGVILYDRHRNKEKVLKGSRQSVRAKLLKVFSADELYTKIFLVVFSGVVMGLGLFLSASRGGIISMTAALVVMGIFLTGIKKYRRPGLYILIPFFILTAVYAISAGIDPTVDRFRQFESGYIDRAALTEKTLGIFDDYQVFGVGIGNFSYIFPRYQDILHRTGFVNYAHNDWAQLLAEGGIIGFVILLAGMGFYLFKTMRKWKQAQGAFAVCLGIAPIIALVSIGIHSFSDFNLHIPANVILLIAIIAIGYRSFYPEKEKTDQGFVWIPLRFRATLITGVVAIMILWSGMWVVRHFTAEAYCNTVQTPPLNLNQEPPSSSVRQAIRWDAGNAEYRFKLAKALMTERDKAMMELSSSLIADNAFIIRALEEAIQLNPFVAEYHVRLGWEYSYLWYKKDYQSKWLPAADLCMERASYFSGAGAANPHLQIDMGKYWTTRSKSLEYDPVLQDTAWIKARWHFERALELNNSKQVKNEIAGYVMNIYSDQKRVREAIE